MFVSKILGIIIFFFINLTLYSFSFVWITDTHIETDLSLKKDTEIRLSLSTKILSETINAINKMQEVSFVVITGDVVNSAKSWNLDTAKFLLSKLEKPYFVVIGNNDFTLPGEGIGTGKFDFHLVFSENEPNLKNGIWFVVFNNYLLIGIDNINPQTGSMYFGTSILRELEKILIGNKDIAGSIILLHYPIVEYTYKEKGELQDIAKPFLNLCNKYHVDLILSGHYHYTEFQKINGVYSFIESSLAQYPHKFSIISINQKEISLQRVTAEKNYILNESKYYLMKNMDKMNMFPNKVMLDKLKSKLFEKKSRYTYERRK